MKVEVYWNRHKKKWSIRDAKTHKVVGHSLVVMLKDVEFKVSLAGRNRVLKTGKRNVHALACGYTSVNIPNFQRRVTYNPFKGHTFVDDYGTPVFKSDEVLFDSQGSVWIT